MTDRYRLAWLSARQRAVVLSAEVTRRAPLLGEYASENTKLHQWHDEDRTALTEMRATIERLRKERDAFRDQRNGVFATNEELLAQVQEADLARLRAENEVRTVKREAAGPPAPADAVLAVLPAPAGQGAECPECDDTGACDGGPCPLSRMADEAQQAGRPSCPDPIECRHEAALDQAEEKLETVHATATAWARPDMSEPTRVAGAHLLRVLDGDEAQQAGEDEPKRTPMDPVHILGVGSEDPVEATALRARLLARPAPAVRADTAQQPEVFGPEVVAYRHPTQPRTLLCRQHGDGKPGLTPVEADDLEHGGGCDECGGDVLARQTGVDRG